MMVVSANFISLIDHSILATTSFRTSTSAGRKENTIITYSLTTFNMFFFFFSRAAVLMFGTRIPCNYPILPPIDPEAVRMYSNVVACYPRAPSVVPCNSEVRSQATEVDKQGSTVADCDQDGASGSRESCVAH